MNRLVSPGIGIVSAAVGLPNVAASSTRWVPRLGRSRIDESTSAAHTPAALITTRAARSRVCPVNSSVSRTEFPVAADAPTWVRMRAPCWAAVRATATTSRASSISCPSYASSAPSSPSRRSVGAIVIACCALIRRGRGSTEDGVPANARSTSPARNPVRTSARWDRFIDGSSGTSCGMALTRCGALTPIRMPRSSELLRAIPTLPLAR